MRGGSRDITLNFKGDAKQLNQVISQIVNEVKKVDNAGKAVGGGAGLFGVITGGNLAARGISEAIGFLKQLSGEVVHLGIESVKLAASFEQTTNALTVFTGSQRLAKSELAELNKIAANTAGLRLETAEQGYTRLRALGFEAKLAQGIVKELGEEKILSGATDENLQKVIYNFTQIASGGQKVSQELREILTQMPSLKRAIFDAFGTLDPKKIQSVFDKDTDAAFQRLVDAMARGEAAAGGLNDGFGKLSDSFIQAGRTFGEPILEPLGESLGLIKQKIEENKDTWKDWGQYVADVIRGANAEARDFNVPKTPLEIEGDKANDEFRQSVVGVYNYLTTPRRPDLNEYDLAGKGRKERENAAKSKGGMVEFFKEVVTLSKEITAIQETENDKRAIALEKTKARELSFLKNTSAESLAIVKNRYDEEQALIDLQARYTAQQEIGYVKKSGEARQNYLTSQIASQTGFYNKQIELQAGNDEEIQKLTSEKNKVLGNLESERLTESARTQKQIQDLENRIYEERRQAAIEFGNLQIRESESVYDKLTFNLERSIERQAGTSDAGFDALKEATQKNYEEILSLTKSQYAKQLENLSLTDEQRSNIIKEMYLTEQDLAEQNSRKLLQIEDNRRAKFIENLTFQKEVLSSTLQSMSSLAATFQDSFFNSSTFTGSRLEAFQNLALKRSQISQAGENIKRSKDQESIFLGAQDVFKDSESVEYLESLSQAYLKQIGITGDYIDQEARLKDSIPGVYYEFEKLAKTISVNNVQAFDDLNKAILKHRQTLDSEDAQSEIDYYEALIESEKKLELKDRDLNKLREYNFNLDKARRGKERLDYQQNAEAADQYANSLIGLEERLRKLRDGDDRTKAGVVRRSDEGFLRQQISLAEENIALEQKYYTDAGFLSDQYKNRRLNNEREVFELRQELSQKGNFDQNESDAKVLAYLNSQIKSASEAFADFRIGLADNYLTAITSPFDALEKKLEGLNPIVRGLAGTFLDLGRDIVKAFSQKIIMQLLGLGNGTGSGSSSGGNWFQKIFGAALGGGGFGTPPFAGSSFTSGGGSGSALGASSGLRPDPVIQSVLNGQTPLGSILNQGNGSTGLSSIFGSQGFGNNVGTYGAIGAGAGILGGLVGGRVGGFISGAGAGLGIGAQIGSMFAPGIGTAIGAGVGAIAGGLISLLGGDPKRKRDKKEKIPNLQKGFLEAFAELNQILKDSEGMKFNPPETANTRADAVYAEISSGFNLVFESKKYREEAQKQIEAKKKEADVLRNQIKISVGGNRDYARDALALGNPVFAAGNYFGDNYALAQHATRPHGFIAGGRLGVDRHLGLFADGETIINHKDRLNIITGAGYDVFKAHANIPNYPKYAEGNYFQPKVFNAPASNAANNSTTPQIILQPNIQVIVQGEATEMFNYKMKEVIIDNLKDIDVQTKIALANELGRRITRGNPLQNAPRF